MLREDISAAVNALPDNVRNELNALMQGPLALVNTNLPRDEGVLAISSAAWTWGGNPQVNCVLVLTGRRLIFVSSEPKVIAWSLRSIIEAQVVTTLGKNNNICGYLINGEQFGIDKGWGPEFGARVNFACAVAKIRDIG
jgi:hypothetical protein